MQTVVEIKEDKLEGLNKFLNKRILILSAGYFYEGILVGIDDACVKINDAHIVYETGKWSDVNYRDRQKLHTDSWYVQVGLIESFGLSKVQGE